MSHSDTIKEQLDILDLNLTFSENYFEKQRIQDELCFIYKGKLTYTPNKCFHCQAENDRSIIKWGFKTVRVLLNDVSEYKTYLEVAKQRFRCKNCSQTFLAESSLTNRHCWIANRVKLSVAEKLTQMNTLTGIAKEKRVSASTVYRVLHQFYEAKISKKSSLPKVLCMDEFKSVRRVSGAMSFIMMDGETKKLVDIVDNRQLPNLRNYFQRFDRSAREGVQWIVTDFYSPYDSLRKELFPNAQLIIDRFHISQHIGRAFLSHRIACMKPLRNGNYSEQQQYRHLKKYWKLLQKNAWELDHQKQYWRPSFRDYLTNQDIVDRLLSYSTELKQGYEVYQEFLAAVHWKNPERFNQLLQEDYQELPESYRTVIHTFQKYKQAIQNALTQPYSNGPLEAENNHIKVLKRISYGFRSFKNFKLRIFLLRGKIIWRTKKGTKKLISS